jgi:hypothetical protein
MELPSPSITGRPLAWIKVDAGVFSALENVFL